MNHIKTNNKRARQRGTTLIELSVVIAVILLLVGVLFIGVQAWRDGANKAASLVNMSSIQKAVRGYQNINQLNVNDPLTSDQLVTANFFSQLPKDPYNSNADYTYLSVVPPSGTQYATSGTLTLTPAQTANW
jgi:prepilin-type N-terminal cleavage/methylation domain-containing protein